MKKHSKKSFVEIIKANKIAFGFLGGLVAVLVIIAIISSATTAYLKPYEKKYGIKYPRGIAEEFCDAYGQNSMISAKLTFADSGDEVFVSDDDYQDGNHFDSGSAANLDQQLNSISIESSSANIEDMYSSMKKYQKSSQKITLTDIYGKSKKYQVVAAYYANTQKKDDNGYVFPYYAHGDLTEDSFNEYEDRIFTRSLYHTSFDMSYTGKYLSINSDTDFMKNFRFVILCVEVSKGDSITPYTDAVKNEKTHYPQVWYDKKEKHNPYWLSSKWQPEIYTDKKHKVTEKM